MVLNACKSEYLGNKLREIGVPHVVCWRSIVQDTTATQFAVNFYKSLDKIHPGNKHPIYKQAFNEACSEACFNEACSEACTCMDSHMEAGGGAARGIDWYKKHPHLHPDARDYVCLLSEAGDDFPKTGHIVKKKPLNPNPS